MPVFSKPFTAVSIVAALTNCTTTHQVNTHTIGRASSEIAFTINVVPT